MSIRLFLFLQRKPVIGLLAAAWSLLVLAVFLERTADLSRPLTGFLTKALLAALSAYAYVFTGFRIRRRLPRLLPDTPDPLESFLIETGLGLAAFVAALILGGALGLYGRPFAWCILGAALLGNHAPFLAEAAVRVRGLMPGPGWVFPAAILAIAWGMSFFQSLAPPACQDALVYHLAVPARYIEEGGFARVPGNFYAQFPANMEMLFTLGLLLDGGGLAQWHHWLLGVAAAASVGALARALSGRGTGLLAAAVFATIPTAMLIQGWAYVDLAVVFFATMSAVALVRWAEREEAPWLVVSALFAGLAAGTKYTGGLQGLLVAGAVLALGVLRRTPSRAIIARAAGAAAIAGIVASPWWIKNVVETGNPLYPFCFSIFGGDGWDAERAATLSAMLSEWGGDRGLFATLLLPWRVTMSGEFFSEENFDGLTGCAFLAGLPFCAAAALRSRAGGLAALLCLGHALFWVATTRQVRFLLPALAIASALIAAGLSDEWFPRRSRAAAAAVVKAALAVNVAFASTHFASHDPLPVVLGLEPEGRYLAREVPGGDYAVFEHIERELPEDAHILLGSLGNPGFLVKRRYTSDALFENRTLAEILRGAPDADAALEAFRARGFTHLLFRWENVFDPSGRRSEIPLEDQTKLMGFLNRHGRLLTGVRGTLLYELGEGIGRGE
jgi:hypothetical protein